MRLDYQINGLSYSQLSMLKDECLVSAESDREVQLKGKKKQPNTEEPKEAEIVPDDAEIHNVICYGKLRRCGLN